MGWGRGGHRVHAYQPAVGEAGGVVRHADASKGVEAGLVPRAAWVVADRQQPLLDERQRGDIEVHLGTRERKSRVRHKPVAG